MSESLHDAVVILNFHDEERVVLLTNKVYEADRLSDIYIVDNESSEISKAKLSSCPNSFLLTSAKNLGYTEGHNLAFKEILKKEYEFVFVLNSDIDFENNLFDCCRDAMRSFPNLGLLTARMVEHGEEKPCCWRFPTYKEYINQNFWYLRKLKSPNTPYIIDEKQKVNFVDAIRGSFQCIRFSALKSITGYDPNCFMYNFENIFCLELRKRGYQTGILSNCFYKHNHNYRRSSKDYQRKRISYKDTKYFLRRFMHVNKIGMLFYSLTFYTNYFLLYCYKKISGPRTNHRKPDQERR